jgi:hypothetical protein
MQYLLDFVNSATEQEVQDYLNTYGCTVLKQWDNFEKIFLVESNSVPPTSALLERFVEEVPLKIKPLLIEGDTNEHFMCHEDPTKPKITINPTDEKDWWKNYTYTTPSFEDGTYTISRLADNINVYIVDSGIEKTHPEFVNANITDLYTVTPGDFGDNKGHGTALASVISGATCGITNAKIKNVKIFDPNHATLQSEFLSALDAIINDHQPGHYSIANCSWIIEKNEWVEHKLKILFDNGVFIVASAGNQGTSIEDVTPASMVEAFTVGAYDEDLKPCDFSNYTSTSMISVTGNIVNHGELDGWAPGKRIWAAGLNGTYGYVYGTSIATAIVSAVAASNISWFADDNGKIYPYYDYAIKLSTNDPSNGAGSGLVFNKRDLLDLSIDPKYSESKNLIAGLLNKCTNVNTQLPDEFIYRCRLDSTGKTKIIGGVFNPNNTKKVEWIDPLPTNFDCLVDGLIVGNPTLDQGPTSGEYSKLYVAKFNRTNSDDTVDLVTVKIYVVEENLKPADLPDDHDPELKIALQAGFCSSFTSGCYVNFTNGCGYGCSGGATCCGNDCGKGFYDCYCIFACP